MTVFIKERDVKGFEKLLTSLYFRLYTKNAGLKKYKIK